MSTQVIVIGKPEKGKTKTAIEFQSFLNTNLSIDGSAYSPSRYKYIVEMKVH